MAKGVPRRRAPKQLIESSSWYSLKHDLWAAGVVLCRTISEHERRNWLVGWTTHHRQLAVGNVQWPHRLLIGGCFVTQFWCRPNSENTYCGCGFIFQMSNEKNNVHPYKVSPKDDRVLWYHPTPVILTSCILFVYLPLFHSTHLVKCFLVPANIISWTSFLDWHHGGMHDNIAEQTKLIFVHWTLVQIVYLCGNRPLQPLAN